LFRIYYNCNCMKKIDAYSTALKLSFIGLFCGPFFTLTKANTLLPSEAHYIARPDSIGTEIINDQLFVIHRVEPKDTYYGLSRRYKAPVNAIIDANNKKNLKPGDTVKVPTGRKAVATTAPSQPTTTQTPATQPTTTQSPTGRAPKPVEPKGRVAETKPETTVNTVAPANDVLTSYKVGKSETLYAISRRFNTTVDEIKKLNNLTSNSIGEGLLLKIPNSVAVPPVVETPAIELPVVVDTPEVDEPTGSGRELNFEPSRYGIREKKEKGIAVWMDNLETKEKSNLALHKTAPIGTILKITNPMTKSVTYAKVVGKFTDNADNQDAIVILSKSAASYIGALDRRFLIEIAYGVPLQEQ